MIKGTDIPKGYKQTKVGVIPEDWEIVKLGELFDFKNGVNADKDAYGSGVKFINIMEVINNNSIYHDMIPGSVNLEEKQLLSNIVEYGDILFNRTSETREEIGLTAVYLDNEKPVFGGFVIRGRSKDSRLNHQFKKDCLQSLTLRKQIISKGQGAVRANIGQKDLEQVLFPLPPLNEQQKIAEILTTWDKSISSTQGIIDELKLRNKGLAQQLLTGKKRLEGYNDNWKSLRLGDITEKFSMRNKNLIDARVYSVTNYSGFVLQSEHFSREVAGDDLTSYKIISKGEFAYNPARINVGSIAYFDKEEKGVISSLYVCFRTNDLVIDKFISHWISLDKTYHDFGRYGEGGVRIYLWYDLFAKIKIEIPPLKEQEAIIQILDEGERELFLYERKLTTLKEQRKA